MAIRANEVVSLGIEAEADIVAQMAIEVDMDTVEINLDFEATTHVEEV